MYADGFNFSNKILDCWQKSIFSEISDSNQSKRLKGNRLKCQCREGENNIMIMIRDDQGEDTKKLKIF